MSNEYQYKFLCNRQIPLIASSDAKEYDEAFGMLLNYIGEEIDKKNCLYKLINRKDVFSTIELLELALAIKRINKIDSNWVRKQLQLATGKDDNNAQGAITEIMTLGSLYYSDNCEYKVKPASYSNPGIDGYLTYNNGMKVELSIKHYGESYHEREFKNNCEKICKEFERILSKDFFSIQMTIDFKYYPNTKSWEKLRKYLVWLLGKYQKCTRQLVAMISGGQYKSIPTSIDGDISIVFGPLREKCQYAGKPSYILSICTKPHPNDFKGVLDKIQSAVYNLSKYYKPEKNKKSALFIHMPNAYPLQALSGMISSYLNKQTNKIDYIILYTTIIAYDKSSNRYIYHVINLYSRNSDKGINFKFKKAYGRVLDEIPFPRFDGIGFPEVKDRYFFQRGQINQMIEQVSDDNKEWRGNLGIVAPGIERICHIVLEDGTVAIKAIDNIDDELLIS